ncbi:hypothetical protein BKA56DRAFT_617706 [Ilyonectria sp. MPI-CAGE-AT-0026]|nr:hypothetical protein BKA56DRAFT_617706 [Ilyonectria sp. MPI-CAGE-AT-0026]
MCKGFEIKLNYKEYGHTHIERTIPLSYECSAKCGIMGEIELAMNSSKVDGLCPSCVNTRKKEKRDREWRAWNTLIDIPSNGYCETDSMGLLREQHAGYLIYPGDGPESSRIEIRNCEAGFEYWRKHGRSLASEWVERWSMDHSGRLAHRLQIIEEGTSSGDMVNAFKAEVWSNCVVS